MAIKTTPLVPKVEQTELTFDNLNPVGEVLDYILAPSPAELLAEIKKVKLPLSIVTIYASGSNHIAWVRTFAKLKKIRK